MPVEAPSRWRAAAVWALPFSLWVVVTLAAVAMLPVNINQLISLHRSYAYTAKNFPDSTGEADRAVHDVDFNQSLVILANVGVLTVPAVSTFVYKRRVPLHWRGTWRALVLALGVTFFVGIAGFLVLAGALAGSIRG